MAQGEPHRARSRSIAVLLVTVALAVAGCGSSSDSDSAGDDIDKPTSTRPSTDDNRAAGSTSGDGGDDVGRTTVASMPDVSLSFQAAGAELIDEVEAPTFCAGVEGFANAFESLSSEEESGTVERPEATPEDQAAFEAAAKAWAGRVLKVAPDEIRAEFEIYAADPTGLESADATPDVVAAGDRLQTYTEENCDLPNED